MARTVVTVSEGPNDTLALHSVWDPGVLDVIRMIPGRSWDKPRKRWLIPADADLLDTLSKLLTRHGARLDCDPVLATRLRHARTAVAEARAIAAADDAQVDFPFVTQPYAHQRAGLAFLQRLGSGGLLWEMGLGKTKTAIDHAEWLAQVAGRTTVSEDYNGRRTTVVWPGFHVLVVCPNTVKDNWGREIAQHAGHEDFIIPAGSLAKRATQVATARYTIVNTEALSSGAFAKALMAREWDLVIVDESTRFKNHRAMRTKHLLKLKARHRVILTGTPLTNSPEDIYTQLSFVAPRSLGSWYEFRDRYLALDFFKNVVGVKAGMEQELEATLAKRTYRRLKAEVLDLPPKVYVDRVTELSEVQKAAYRSMKDDMLMRLDSGDLVVAASILAQLLRLTQVTAGLIGQGDEYQWDATNPKLAELDWIINDEARGEPVVIFGIYQEELRQLARRYCLTGPQQMAGEWARADQRLPIIYGPTRPEERTRFIAEFQRGDRRLLFVQSHTGGMGINLTAARTAVYYTRGWSLEDYLQSQDRLHRIGQRGTVTILHLVAKGTIDEDIAKALARKQDMADMLTGDTARRVRSLLEGG